MGRRRPMSLYDIMGRFDSLCSKTRCTENVIKYHAVRALLVPGDWQSVSLPGMSDPNKLEKVLDEVDYDSIGELAEMGVDKIMAAVAAACRRLKMPVVGLPEGDDMRLRFAQVAANFCPELVDGVITFKLLSLVEGAGVKLEIGFAGYPTALQDGAAHVMERGDPSAQLAAYLKTQEERAKQYVEEREHFIADSMAAVYKLTDSLAAAKHQFLGERFHQAAARLKQITGRQEEQEGQQQQQQQRGEEEQEVAVNHLLRHMQQNVPYHSKRPVGRRESNYFAPEHAAEILVADACSDLLIQSQLNFMAIQAFGSSRSGLCSDSHVANLQQLRRNNPWICLQPAEDSPWPSIGSLSPATVLGQQRAECIFNSASSMLQRLLPPSAWESDFARGILGRTRQLLLAGAPPVDPSNRGVSHPHHPTFGNSVKIPAACLVRTMITTGRQSHMGEIGARDLEALFDISGGSTAAGLRQEGTIGPHAWIGQCGIVGVRWPVLAGNIKKKVHDLKRKRE